MTFSVLAGRLGFPDATGRGRTVLAVAIDAVGSGVFMPVSLLYFVATTELSLVATGGALTVAAALGLPAGPVAGALVDRWGARRVLLGGNVLQALSFTAFLWIDSFLAVTLWAAVNALGRTAFWGAFSVAVAGFTVKDAREGWFGFFGALRNLGFAVGGLLAGAAITIGTPSAFRAVVLLNILSFCIALALLVRADELPSTTRREPLPGAWRTVLHDRPYRLLVVLQVLYSTAMTVMVFAAPAYITVVLGLPGWVAGVAFTLNAAMVGLLQGIAVHLLTGTLRWRALALAHVTFVGGYLLFLVAGLLPMVGAAALVIAGTIVFTVGELIGTPVQASLSVDAALGPLMGRYTSLIQLAHHAAHTVAPLTFAGLLDEGTPLLWVVLMVIAGLAVTLSVVLAAMMPAARTRVAVPAQRSRKVRDASQETVG